MPVITRKRERIPESEALAPELRKTGWRPKRRTIEIMSLRRWLSFLVVMSSLFVLPAVASADDGADGVLKAKQTDLTAQLRKGKGADEKKVAAIFDELLDYSTLSKDSLGSHWEDLSDAERKDFQDLLKRLVRAAYRKNLKKTLNYDIDYEGVIETKTGVLVKTVAKHKSNSREEPVHIDYAMHKVDGKWEIGDIITEGGSLVGNYKSQFGRVIKKKGFAELMKRMKAKATKEKA